MSLTWGRTILAAVMSSGISLIAATPVAAQEKVVAVRFDEQDSLATVLKRLEGRAVKIRQTGSADEIAGKVQKVGKELVHISGIAGREFYDAWIRVDQVSSIVVQVRDLTTPR